MFQRHIVNHFFILQFLHWLANWVRGAHPLVSSVCPVTLVTRAPKHRLHLLHLITSVYWVCGAMVVIKPPVLSVSMAMSLEPEPRKVVHYVRRDTFVLFLVPQVSIPIRALKAIIAQSVQLLLKSFHALQALLTTPRYKPVWKQVVPVFVQLDLFVAREAVKVVIVRLDSTVLKPHPLCTIHLAPLALTGPSLVT